MKINQTAWYINPLDDHTNDCIVEIKKPPGTHDTDATEMETTDGEKKLVWRMGFEDIARFLRSAKSKELKFSVYESRDGGKIFRWTPITSKGNVKKVFVAHPMRGKDIHINKMEVLRICEEYSSKRVSLYAPYIAKIKQMQSSEEDQLLSLAEDVQFLLTRIFQEVWLYGDAITPGMREVVLLARRIGIDVVAKTAETKRDLKLLLG